MTSNTPRPTRSEQREAARAKAKAMREQQKKGDKRNRILIQIGIVTSVLVASGAIAFAIFSASNQTEAVPANATFNGGVKVGSGLQLYTPGFAPPEIQPDPIEIVIYVDYQCPACALFELPNSEQIREWVSSGVATLELHPISFLDQANRNYFSSRAANAALCVADYSPGNFFDYNTRLFQIQPVGDDRGPDSDGFIALAQEVGSTNIEQLSDCIESNRFVGFVKNETSRTLGEPYPGTDVVIDGTPTIFVNGVEYKVSARDLSNPARFAQFVQLVTAEATK
jgi:protein-disulfide isomerase